jgi:hypothetical protein
MSEHESVAATESSSWHWASSPDHMDRAVSRPADPDGLRVGAADGLLVDGW